MKRNLELIVRHYLLSAKYMTAKEKAWHFGFFHICEAIMFQQEMHEKLLKAKWKCPIFSLNNHF